MLRLKDVSSIWLAKGNQLINWYVMGQNYETRHSFRVSSHMPQRRTSPGPSLLPIAAAEGGEPEIFSSPF